MAGLANENQFLSDGGFGLFLAPQRFPVPLFAVGADLRECVDAVLTLAGVVRVGHLLGYHIQSRSMYPL